MASTSLRIRSKMKLMEESSIEDSASNFVLKFILFLSKFNTEHNG